MLFIHKMNKLYIFYNDYVFNFVEKIYIFIFGEGIHLKKIIKNEILEKNINLYFSIIII